MSDNRYTIKIIDANNNDVLFSADLVEFKNSSQPVFTATFFDETGNLSFTILKIMSVPNRRLLAKVSYVVGVDNVVVGSLIFNSVKLFSHTVSDISKTISLNEHGFSNSVEFWYRDIELDSTNN